MKIQALFPLKSVLPEKPIRISVIDIESVGFLTPYAACYYDGTRTILKSGLDCIKELLIEIIDRKTRGEFIYGHYAGKFDFIHFIPHLKNLGYHVQPIINGAGSIIQLTITKNKESWTFRDSYAILNKSLKKLAEDFDVPTKKGEFDHTKVTLANYRSLENEWRPYLIDDCKALHQCLKLYQEHSITKYGISLRHAITSAQKALRNYRKNHLTRALPNYRHMEDILRGLYAGGRVGVFKRYAKKLNIYDINSTYPHCMHDKSLPVGRPSYSKHATTDNFGFAQATITSPKDQHIPFLYRKDDKTKKLIFPTGVWTAWYFIPELKYAEKMGYTITIHQAWLFNSARIFTSFVNQLFEEKKNAKKGSVQEYAPKTDMNSTYGKFGQKREKKVYSCTKPEDILGWSTEDHNDLLWSKDKTSESSHIIPAIPCAISSYARMNLYDWILRAGIYNVCYTDTDSVHTTSELPHSPELGAMKLEAKDVEAVYLCPKSYAIRHPDGKIDIKFKGQQERKYGFDKFIRALHNPMELFECVKDGLAPVLSSIKRNKTYVSTIIQKRVATIKMDKRTVHPDGIHTSPLEVITPSTDTHLSDTFKKHLEDYYNPPPRTVRILREIKMGLLKPLSPVRDIDTIK